jgi:hypothetical protein
MEFLGGLSTNISIVSFTLFAAAVMKVFQMATVLTEIKELLASIKHNAAPIQAPAALPLGQSGEEMLRALTAELDHPVPPAALELGRKG